MCFWCTSAPQELHMLSGRSFSIWGWEAPPTLLPGQCVLVHLGIFMSFTSFNHTSAAARLYSWPNPLVLLNAEHRGVEALCQSPWSAHNVLTFWVWESCSISDINSGGMCSWWWIWCYWGLKQQLWWNFIAGSVLCRMESAFLDLRDQSHLLEWGISIWSHRPKCWLAWQVLASQARALPLIWTSVISMNAA